MRNLLVPFGGVLILAACAGSAPQAEPATPADGQVVSGPVVALECEPSTRMPLEGRASPYDSTTVRVGQQALKVCYGRPRAQGREIMGTLLPYDKLWRTGANEPTIIHIPVAASIAGVNVEPGSYSLYTIPTADTWTVIVNRSTSQWGHESSYTPAIEAQEVGRGTASTERLDQHVEQFTIRGEPVAGGADLLLEWERTRVRVPVRTR